MRRWLKAWVGLGLWAWLLFGAAVGPATGQALNPDEAAAMLLNSARQAYNEGNHAFAADRFREFLSRFGNHKDAASARFGLALSLLVGPTKQYQAALEPLNQLAGVQDFADRPLVLHYLGYAHRGLGLEALAQAAAKPNEAPQHQATAKQRFEQAAGFFAQAVQAFEARAKARPQNDPKIVEDWEWSARCRCDQAEMLLRVGKPKEAQAAVEPFLGDPIFSKSRYLSLALYHHGHAAFLQKDYATAMRSLSCLAPFNEPVIGLHVRYLLARTHHLAGENPEAVSHYEAVLNGHEEQKKAAAQALQNPATFKDNPDEKLRLEALVRDPPPEHVIRSVFYLGVLLSESGRFADASTRFNGFVQQFPNHSLTEEARFRLGVCQAQLKQFAEATKTLQPLENHPILADRVLFWLARAQIGSADPNNAGAYDQAVRQAIDRLRRAADRANQIAGSDPEARLRRGDCLMELADAHQKIKQFREAAAVYAQVVQEKPDPERAEEALQRQAAALHLAGQYRESEEVCQRFMQTYPKSPLLADVAFRHAENAYLTALAAVENPNLPNRDAELKRLFAEAAKRYETMLSKYPEFAHAHLARQGLGSCLHRLGDFEKAIEVLQAVPPAERSGPLSSISYLLADCILRTVPQRADDAIAAGRMQEQLSEAAKLLEAYLAVEPSGPHAPDALLKLGLARRQTAELLAEPQERNQTLAASRQSLEKLIQQFPQHPLFAQAVLERAKVLVRQGDVSGAIQELNRFQNDPLRSSPVAPVAMIYLASLHRAQNRPAEAVKVLETARQQHEGTLAADPKRIELALALRYHHGLALREAGRLTDARNVFGSIARDFAQRPEAADGAWRSGQCRREELLQSLEEVRKVLSNAQAKPEEVTAAQAKREEVARGLRELVQYFQDQANAAAQKNPKVESRLRLLYEAAWTCRTLGELEHEAARRKLQEEAQKKRQEELAKATPPGQPVPAVRLPDLPASAVPLQPFEQKAREFYQAVIATDADALLAQHARLELAELHALRSEHNAAVPLLRAALEKEPPPDLADRIRLRLGSCLLAGNDLRGAFAQFDAVVQGQRQPAAADARCRAAECLLQLAQQDVPDAAKQAIQYLTPFRDQQPFQNVPGVSDRGLLRLGHALTHAGQWDQARQAFEILLQRFPNSPFAPEARYGIGWCWQNQKQYDQAVQSYAQVVQMTTTEVAARSQLQMGLCRLEQKRLPEAANALLVVPFTYDYPDLSALALCEASRVFAEMKQPQQAARLLERVIKDHPQSPWAEVARQRLAELR
ncbi:MAG: tetratricopeptide repeat protein [Gemmatales bacterium]|nr:tetratricopeptide repeat protein [Gemmatales bacterium]MDW8387299.1 tetratricopeptide repeat protein [Gemmatales bacterium]